MVILYLIITFIFSWALWIPDALLNSTSITHPLLIWLSQFSNYGAWGPLVSALITTIIIKRKKGLIKLFKQTFNLNFNKKWLLPTLFLFPLMIGLPLLYLYITNQPIPKLDEPYSIFILPIVFLIIFVSSGPLQEEHGWRGILQNSLQTKINPLFASIITGLIWGLWHLPLFFIPEQGFYYNRPIWGLILSTTLISILFTWIYNNTNKNLFLMMIFHTTYNFSHYIFPSIQSDASGLIYFLLLLITVCGVIIKSGINLGLKK
ncbi:MAG: CPBP family intramembrane metalloprotease [Candidatus Pacebacteria bacterium]|nr:CPBP family intramembrane metalloprotease [Candidatus Paceibacterota bacterium]